jgi:sulfate permease, SulP family
VAIAAGVIAVMLGARLVNRHIPGALIAIAGAIILSRLAGLDSRGVATVGPVPNALPRLGLPALAPHDVEALLGAVLSMFVVIVAQSAATSRAYAAKYREGLDDETDLVGLGAANIAAAFSGTFVVNGAVGKTQIVDSAGGRSQLAQLVTSVVVLLTLLLLTGLLTDLPVAALAAVVFLIGVRLVDMAGMRRLLAVRPPVLPWHW